MSPMKLIRPAAVGDASRWFMKVIRPQAPDHTCNIEPLERRSGAQVRSSRHSERIIISYFCFWLTDTHKKKQRCQSCRSSLENQGQGERRKSAVQSGSNILHRFSLCSPTSSDFLHTSAPTQPKGPCAPRRSNQMSNEAANYLAREEPE